MKSQSTYSMLVVTAPSGSGKTTVVRHLLQQFSVFQFSVSATTRSRRPGEQEGKDYYFLSPEEFEKRREAGQFLEWEEVYEGQYYGTLHSEVERIRSLDKIVIFDIEVNGAQNIKKQYEEEALCLFIAPPGMQELERRLTSRGTETDATIQTRLTRAKKEIMFLDEFDLVLINEDKEECLAQAEQIVRDYFIKS